MSKVPCPDCGRAKEKHLDCSNCGYEVAGGSATPTGTLIEVGVGNTLQRDGTIVHHSIEFDGVKGLHTTACGLDLPTDEIERVQMDVPETLAGVEDVCTTCALIHAREG